MTNGKIMIPPKPVYDVNNNGPGIVDNSGINAVVTDNGAFWIVLMTATVKHFVRYD